MRKESQIYCLKYTKCTYRVIFVRFHCVCFLSYFPWKLVIGTICSYTTAIKFEKSDVPVVIKTFVIDLSSSFLRVLNDNWNTYKELHCTCGREKDHARVALPSYRLCTTNECQEHCAPSKNPTPAPAATDLSPGGNESTTHQPAENKSDAGFCIRRIAGQRGISCQSLGNLSKDTSQNGVCSGGKCCPNLQQFRYFKKYSGLCLESEEKLVFLRGSMH